MRVCAVCNEVIPEGRLDAVPDTVLCITHARAAEKYGGEFKMTGVIGNIAKEGSLKKNYGGGVSVHRERNYRAIDKLREEHGN